MSWAGHYINGRLTLKPSSRYTHSTSKPVLMMLLLEKPAVSVARTALLCMRQFAAKEGSRISFHTTRDPTKAITLPTNLLEFGEGVLPHDNAHFAAVPAGVIRELDPACFMCALYGMLASPSCHLSLKLSVCSLPGMADLCVRQGSASDVPHVCMIRKSKAPHRDLSCGLCRCCSHSRTGADLAVAPVGATSNAPAAVLPAGHRRRDCPDLQSCPSPPAHHLGLSGSAGLRLPWPAHRSVQCRCCPRASACRCASHPETPHTGRQN